MLETAFLRKGLVYTTSTKDENAHASCFIASGVIQYLGGFISLFKVANRYFL